MAKTNGSIAFNALADEPRLLLECDLSPLQGHRFQPTGFADLGPARYTAPDGTEMLLVESAQSVANRLESAIWDDATDDLITGLKGLPYIHVTRGGNALTNSILEAHRTNSPYILEGGDKKVFDQLKKDAAGLETGPVRLHDLAKIVFKYDPNAVLHGVFFAKKELAGGRLRMSRLISGFVEAWGVNQAESGGVKNDRVDPSGDKMGLPKEKGTGNVPFPRTEFTAERITAYFNLDLALLRGYNLPDEASRLLIALALFKIRRFLSTGLRLRTACDLEPVNGGLRVTRPEAGFTIPDEFALLEECGTLIAQCANAELFSDVENGITSVEWKPSKRKGGGKKDESAGEGDEEDATDTDD